MYNAIVWSYNLLTKDEKIFFQRLGIFVGGWTIPACEAICTTDLPFDAYEGLERMLQKSLIRQTLGIDTEPRFNMLDTIRSFAWDEMCKVPKDKVDAHWQRYADFSLNW